MRISVVVPALNEETHLPATLRSLQGQDCPFAYEVIVVDNASTDATPVIARSFDVRLLHEPRPGVCAARQRGTAAAQGHIVISTDADTVHPRDWLARVDAAFSSSEEVALVAGPCRYQNPSWWAALYPRLLFGAVAAWHARTGRLAYVTATNVAFLRGAFPGYDPALSQGGDELALLRRMRGRGRSVWLADNAVDTSARRLDRGLLYSLFVSLLGRYLLSYGVSRLLSWVAWPGATRAASAPDLSPGPAAYPTERPADALAPRRGLNRLTAALSVLTALLVTRR